jgi:hypothetical protein
MGISSKWIKSLVGIKKHGKSQNAETSRQEVRQMLFPFSDQAFPFCITRFPSYKEVRREKASLTH